MFMLSYTVATSQQRKPSIGHFGELTVEQERWHHSTLGITAHVVLGVTRLRPDCIFGVAAVIKAEHALTRAVSQRPRLCNAV